MAQYPNLKSTGNKGSIMLGMLEPQYIVYHIIHSNIYHYTDITDLKVQVCRALTVEQTCGLGLSPLPRIFQASVELMQDLP